MTRLTKLPPAMERAVNDAVKKLYDLPAANFKRPESVTQWHDETKFACLAFLNALIESGAAQYHVGKPGYSRTEIVIPLEYD